MIKFTLFKRRELRVPTWQGWLVLATVLVLGIVVTGRSLYPFLALTSPVRGEILVVEGWAPDQVLIRALAEFRAHDYRLLVTAGGPLASGFFLSEYKDYAVLCAASLIKLGMDTTRLAVVPAPLADKDRTYVSALAIRDWLAVSGQAPSRIDVFTTGPHARRTRLLYTKALGDKITVGIIAADEYRYDPRQWWRTSNGVRTVLDETIAYLYARLLFWP
jgi:hypothetical protein